MRRSWLILLVAVVGIGVIPSVSQAAKPPKCVSTDNLSLDPTTTAPDWYQPGVTKFCSKGGTSDPIVEPATAYWVYYIASSGQERFRTTPDNADYSAQDCIDSYTTCGLKIIGDANDFYTTCHDGFGLSASQVATNIRYWADRARANGTNWRVYTYLESGGYPYSCAFSVAAI
jgi:hypothetical protein